MRLPHRVIEREGVNQEYGMAVTFIKVVDNVARLEPYFHRTPMALLLSSRAAMESGADRHKPRDTDEQPRPTIREVQRPSVSEALRNN